MIVSKLESSVVIGFYILLARFVKDSNGPFWGLEFLLSPLMEDLGGLIRCNDNRHNGVRIDNRWCWNKERLRWLDNDDIGDRRSDFRRHRW
jgi:hypothetical protein